MTFHSEDFFWEPSVKEFVYERDYFAKRPENLSPITVSEWDRGKGYLSPSGDSGFFLTDSGELRSVFNGGEPGQGADAVRYAIQLGANRLDCYDGFLVDYYSRFGFYEISRESFNDEYAPAGWDYERLGRPDVVYMERD